MTDAAPAHQNPFMKALQGQRLGMVVLIAALLFLVFTVIYAINVAQSRHQDQTMAAATKMREAADQRRYENVVRNQKEIIRDLNTLLSQQQRK